MVLLSLAAQAGAQITQREQLSKAILNLDQKTVIALINAGTSVTTADNNGFVPLLSLVIAGSRPEKASEAIGIAQVLLNAGADIKQEGPVGNSPLAVACSQGNNLKFVEFLIGRGADVNQFGYNNTFPLYQAIRKERAAIAQVLIEHGADVKAKSANNITALHFAVLNGMRSTVELLIAHGADINARDIEGKTPLSWSFGKIPSDFIGTAVPIPAMSEILRKNGATE